MYGTIPFIGGRYRYRSLQQQQKQRGRHVAPFLSASQPEQEDQRTDDGEVKNGLNTSVEVQTTELGLWLSANLQWLGYSLLLDGVS